MATLEIILLSILGYILIGGVSAFIITKMDYNNVVKDGWGRPIYVDYATRTSDSNIFMIIAFWPLLVLYLICMGFLEFMDWFADKLD